MRRVPRPDPDSIRQEYKRLLKAHVEHLTKTKPNLKSSTIYSYARQAATAGKWPPGYSRIPPIELVDVTTQPPPPLYDSDALCGSQGHPEVQDIVPEEAATEYMALPYSPPLFSYQDANSNPVAELASRELCRRRLLPFIKRFRPNYTAGWFHADICRRVERFVERVERMESPRLLLMAPPRSGKSEVLSRNAPAWIIGKHPDWELIAASYAGALTMTFSRYIRDLLRDPAYQALYPTAKLDPSSQSVEAWNTTMGGGYVAAGQGGPITGKGAHCFPAGTKVRTPRGSVSIESIRPGDAIVGYNHRSGIAEDTTVKAVRISRRSDLVRITTECGREIVATADHPFFTVENGLKCYSYAEILQPGSQLLTCYLSSQMSEKVGQDTVLMVEKLCGDDVEVYDIQVEGTSNFFAEEILVHNCFFIDDIVKDHEAAQSLDQREKTWEWWNSTAYTRLSPGGGVIALMCMTGDTPVLMADGTQRRLDSLATEDSIATYRNGVLSTSRVAAMKSSGRDSIYKITTTSDRIVRANQRHPFLTISPDGELVWTRVQSLTTTHKIVTLKDSGENGKALFAQWKGVKSQPNVEGCVTRTTARKNGPTGTALGLMDQKVAAGHGSKIGMVLPQRTTTGCSSNREDGVPFAEIHQAATRSIGTANSPSTTATSQVGCGPFCATAVTQESGTLKLSPWHLPQQNTCDFTAEQIISIEFDGEEEVFDVQVDDTENFIANGVVSHNTNWHADDWAGRIQETMTLGGEVYEVIKYPAINDYGDEYILPDDSIIQIADKEPVPQGALMTRPKNTAIHPERYDTQHMLRIKNNLEMSGQKAVWNALYQQNPVPDEGSFFQKDMFRYYSTPPARRDMYIYQAWDFAISTGKENDYTVGITIGVDHRDAVYVLDMRRFRSGDGIEIAQTILEYSIEWGTNAIGVEDGQIWKAIESQFLKACEEHPSRHFPSYEPLKPLTDKKVRADPLRGRMQAGKVYFDKEAHYFSVMQKELITFPNGKWDDVVDGLAWAVRLTLTRTPPREARQPQHKSWRDKLKAHMAGTHGGGTHMSA